MEATTHPATAGGTTHRIYIGKEEGRWAGTHQVLMNRGKEGHLVVVGMGLLVLVVGVKVHGAMVVVVGMMNSCRIQSPWRRQNGELSFPLVLSLLLPFLYPLLFSCLA